MADMNNTESNMLLDECDYETANEETAGKTGNDDDAIEATIVMVKEKGLVADHGATRIFIPAKEASWKYVLDCRTLPYHRGMTVKAKLLDAKDRFGNPVASMRDFIENDNEKYFSDFKVDDVVYGYVTHSYENSAGKRSWIVDAENKAEVFCWDPAEAVKVGDVVCVTITKKNEETRRIYGRITQVGK